MNWSLNCILLCALFLTPVPGATTPLATSDLRAIAFDKELPLKQRWKALSVLAMSQKEKALPDIRKALKSRDWFMRNAGLESAAYVDPDMALIWAAQLIRDPSLVVRTSAVKMIRKRGNASHRPLLWKELNSPINFRKGQSLWVRHHIVDTVGTLSSPADISRFVNLLDDADGRVRRASIVTLEKLSNEKIGDPTDSVNQRAKKWKAWWKTKGSQKSI